MRFKGTITTETPMDFEVSDNLSPIEMAKKVNHIVEEYMAAEPVKVEINYSSFKDGVEIVPRGTSEFQRILEEMFGD